MSDRQPIHPWTEAHTLNCAAKLEAPEEKQSAEVVDLMERLRRSLQAGGSGKSATRARSKKATAASKKTARGSKKRRAA